MTSLRGDGCKPPAETLIKHQPFTLKKVKALEHFPVISSAFLRSFSDEMEG